MRVSDELRTRIAQLRRSRVRFDATNNRFFDSKTGRVHPGLTDRLAAVVPVPFDRLAAGAERDAVAQVPKSVHRYSGATMARCAQSCANSLGWARAQRTPFGEAARAEKNADKLHGSVVDEQLSLYVQHGRTALFTRFAPQSVDPCVGTLLEHFGAQRLACVATQVPLADRRANVATAIDLLLTDRETRTKLILVELKATRARDAALRADTQYERIRGVLRDSNALQGVPLSYYSRHQLQLYAMHRMAETRRGVHFDDAQVVRVAPGLVRVYPLNQFYQTHAPHIIEVLRRPKKRARLK